MNENERRPLDLIFEALAHPVRRKMVERLSRGSATLGELAGPLALPPQIVAEQLHVLVVSGLVRWERSGTECSCRLVPSVLAQAERWLGDRESSWESRRLDRLQDYLAEGQERASRRTAPP
ncbi:ArsR/SmtB family transcription factor [Streptomyces iconiensis]|uniref:Helix-turn-helix domain-containing protein n=1 Tax=Streptomyces iconiensis TaxID=1384038 RepID=A0ABT6ZU70_9ACTN|nr:helix-turn-helix domain-containing protein [Streptomyces iconiensis]MDJ1132607.1 helix-turn-helix domain-containing protein [Streptomyces iconiensis]